ncbi:germination protein GerLC [Paraliobacillus quinghaiensis]|uniref:Germination protein GerLC n=1 Tax=Paraliobacillus quinghaiensis TaxID=470815 RepID=A0A917WS05_9BACI|nr:Ger(x)C family spore germination protein [Paraliobacillus quinghaiensis]GGM23725.1 germination protein GerLC [Paraliobacillus quinghaiensis]
MKKAIPLFLILILLSGCWDSKEIEEIGFVMGVGLDPAEGDAFETTFQIAIPSQLVQQSSPANKGKPPFINVSSVGKSNFKNIRQIGARRSRTLNFEHLQVIVIHTELLELGILEHILDVYLRDHEMRRRTLILASEDPVKELLKNQLPLESFKAKSIEKIQENYQRVLSMPKLTSIGDISRYIPKETGYIIPLISKFESDEVIIEGGAIINGSDKLVGLLNPLETEGYNRVIGETNQSVTEVKADDEVFVYESYLMNSYISFEHTNDENTFHITIKTEGAIGESWLNQKKLSENKFLFKLQTLIEQKIEKEINGIVKVMQEEYYTDVFGFGDIIKSENS